MEKYLKPESKVIELQLVSLLLSGSDEGPEEDKAEFGDDNTGEDWG